MARVRISARVRRLLVLGWLDGQRGVDLARQFSVSAQSVSRIVHDPAMVQQLYVSRPGRLCLAEREDISRGLARGDKPAEIARTLGRVSSTVTREINNNGGVEGYRAYQAHAAACERARRPKPTKFEQNPALAAAVENMLETEQWSPAQISARLCQEFPDDDSMRVAPETIYQALYVYGRGGLRKELAVNLRVSARVCKWRWRCASS